MSSIFEWTRMRSQRFSVVGIALFFSILANLGLAAEPVAATTPAEPATGLVNPWLADWSPALNVEFGIHAQEMTAAGSASFGAGDQGTNTISTLFVRLETGIATPPLTGIPGAPRLVLRGGGSFPTRESATILSTQKIETAQLGTTFDVSWKGMWHAALDMRFVLPLPELPLIIQPGIEYLESRFRFEPTFTYRPQPGSPEAQPFPNPSNPPTLSFKGRSGSDINRMIGPSLAIEGAVVQIGPIAINAYLQGRMYWLLGDQSTAVAFSGLLLNQPESASARLKANSIAGQVGFGLRGSF